MMSGRKGRTRIRDEYGLTAKERELCDLVMDNPGRSLDWIYERSSYAARGTRLGLAAAQVLRRPQCREYLVAQRRELAKAKLIERADLVEALAGIAFLDPADLFDENGELLPVGKMPAHVRKAIASIDIVPAFVGHGKDRRQVGVNTKIRFVDKKGALDSLAKIYGYFEAERVAADGISELMKAIAETRKGSTIGRLNEGKMMMDGQCQGPIPAQLIDSTGDMRKLS